MAAWRQKIERVAERPWGVALQRFADPSEPRS
jgi:hypothetical protein